VPSYVEDGLVMGGFYEHHEGTAVYNRGFRPFRSPVPFLLMRHAVISDWKFVLDHDDWLNRWAHRSGESAVRALAEELRRLPWRGGRRIPHHMSRALPSFAVGSPAASDSTRTDASTCTRRFSPPIVVPVPKYAGSGLPCRLVHPWLSPTRKGDRQGIGDGPRKSVERRLFWYNPARRPTMIASQSS
jgi:hypothetical protein